MKQKKNQVIDQYNIHAESCFVYIKCHDPNALTKEESNIHHQTTAHRLTRSPEAVFVVIQLFVVGHTDTADLYSESFRHGGGTEKSQIRTKDGLNLPLTFRKSEEEFKVNYFVQTFLPKQLHFIFFSLNLIFRNMISYIT